MTFINASIVSVKGIDYSLTHSEDMKILTVNIKNFDSFFGFFTENLMTSGRCILQQRKESLLPLNCYLYFSP